jgi:hypothetical protein
METSNLQKLIDTNQISEKERKAIQKVFMERQLMPPTDSGNFS